VTHISTFGKPGNSFNFVMYFALSNKVRENGKILTMIFLFIVLKVFKRLILRAIILPGDPFIFCGRLGWANHWGWGLGYDPPTLKNLDLYN
jgi:hypothetical protein